MNAPELLPGMIERAIEAERAVLSLVMWDTRAFDAARNIIRPQMFFLPEHRQFWEAVEISAEDTEASPDPRAFWYALKSLGYGDCWTIAKVADLADLDTQHENILVHAKEVRAGYYHRERFRTLARAAKDVAESTNFDHVDQICGSTADQLRELTERANGVEVHRSKDLVSDAKAWLKRPQCLATGFASIDRAGCGPVIGRVSVGAGRTSHGKTTVALNIVGTCCHAGLPVWYYTMETSRQSLTNRLAANLSGMGLDALRASPDCPEAVRAYDEIGRWPLQIVDKKQPIQNVIAAVRGRHRTEPVALFVVDFMQRYGQDPQSLDPVFDRLIDFAGSEQIAVLALSQITKNYTPRGAIDTGRPLLVSMKGSGTLGDQAGLVWIIWRPERDGVDQIKTSLGPLATAGKIEINVAKNSDGPTMTAMLNFQEECFRVWE